MKPRTDLAGRRFAKLTVLTIAPPRIYGGEHRRTFWNCVCDCGANVQVETSKLINGHTRSCGCLLRQWRAA